MATIKNKLTGETIILNAQNTFGRNQKNAITHIPDADVSQSHAIIFWKNGEWQLQDYSRNGTLVNGEYVHHSTRKMADKAAIQFGKSIATQWEVIDLNPPSSYLKSLTKPDTILELNTCHILPKGDNTDILIYFSKDKYWKAETVSSTIQFEHGQSYELNGDEWEFVENEPLDDTIDNGNVVDSAHFLFNLSTDEEHIRLKIMVDAIELDLGERAHHYLLFLLAKKRAFDKKNEDVYNDQGWMNTDSLLEEMSKELYKEIDVYYLNLQIHRFRKQLLGVKPYGYLFMDVIERRRGEIRFGHELFQISKDEQTEGKIPVISN
ncbi:FHA domain-containing protein [Aquimarina sp. 2201CG1-2-11]|uniref:FHA domain-containing protein n=1 Tax=Aquimarina discodermiae TaxID=3231043 RepID=UPI00346360EF